MPLYTYTKSPLPTKTVSLPQTNSWLPVICAGLGFFIVGIVAGSFVMYRWRAEAYFRPEAAILEVGEVSGWSSTNEKYLRPGSWFSTPPNLPPRPSRITHYNLSIPALRIQKAVVEIGGESLDRSMIHYAGTALPGQTGNAVVFCHSVLPQFYNPKSYKTICSTLQTLAEGEEIVIHFDGIEYRYLVTRMFEVEPDDTSVLSQDIDGEYLSLITCTPPGTYLRRLVVEARLL